MVESTRKKPNNIPPDTSPSSVAVITLGRVEEVNPVNAVGASGSSAKVKKTPEEIRASLLENLKKAREAKARYRVEDQQALSRGEVPPSVLRKTGLGMPIIMGEDKTMQSFNMKQALWDTKVSVPLPQLLFHAPDLYHQALGLIGAQPSTVKKKASGLVSPDEDMDIDDGSKSKETEEAAVNHMVSIDTTVLGLDPKLQSMLCVVGEMQLEFLVDGGAIVSVVPLEVIEQLGLKSTIEPTNRTLRFGDGEVEAAVGVIKLTMLLSEQVEVTHSFCVTKNVKTPLILGIDFIQGTNGVADSNNNNFRIYAHGQVYDIPTHEGNGVSSEVLFPKGGEVEEDDRLVIPITVTNSDNRRLKNVKIQYEYSMEPGDSHLLWIAMGEESRMWSSDMVLQPDEKLYNKLQLYMVPSLMKQGGEGLYCLVVMNQGKKKVTLKKGTLIGKLYGKDSVPKEVEIVKDVDEIISIVQDKYINQENDHGVEEEILAPSLIMGPIFEPTYEVLQAKGIKLSRSRGYQKKPVNRVYSVYNITLEENEPVFDINPELEEDKKAAIKEVLMKHKKVFASSLKDVDELKAEPYEIKLKEDAKPVKVTPRMVPYEANQWFKGYIDQLLELGLIEKCDGPWAAGVVLVPADIEKRVPRRRKVMKLKISPRIKLNDKLKMKTYQVNVVEQEEEESMGQEELSTFEDMEQAYGIPTGEITSVVPKAKAGQKDPYRLTINYKAVNKLMIDTGYPIPNINFLFTLLAKAQYFSVFDCLKGFWQLKLDEKSKDITGFATTFGQFRWTRLPMGLKGSPSAWQATMDHIFFSEINQFLLIYIDDGLVFSNSFEDHVKHLDVILTKASKACLSLSIAKCRFGYTETKLLGHIVGRNGYRMDMSKVERICNWPQPKNLTEVNRFVGMVQYYRRYIPNMSAVIAPLNQLKKKDVVFNWGEEQERSFADCKKWLMSDAVLAHPDFTRPFVLYTDASNVGIGGVLSQEVIGEKGMLRPIFFGSKALTDQEKRISVYEKEFFAIVYFIHFFKIYLMGHRFLVYTDQKSLQYLIKFNEEASAKIVRWQGSLLAYDFDIIYRAGKLNSNADALSRLEAENSQGPTIESVMPDYYLPLNTVRNRSEDEESNIVSKKKVDRKEIVGFGCAGMSLDKYAALVKFLSTWMYPEGWTEAQRKALRYQARQFEEEGGILYKRANAEFVRRKVVKVTEVHQILKENHDHVLAGHQGVARTFDKIKYKYYWQGYYDSVREYVLSCNICQNFGPRNPVVPTQVTTTHHGLFSVITMDYIHLPLTQYGHMGALVIVDRTSGWIEAYPSTTQSASFTCLCLFEWFSRYGICSKIICDNGSHFNAEEVKSMMVRSYGIELRFGIPFYPQGQGKVERANGVLKDIIRKYLLQYTADWDMWLSAALYVMRTSLRRDYDHSPFFLVYGRHPRELSANRGLIEFENSMSDEELVAYRIEEIYRLNEQVIPQANRRIEVYRTKMKEQYNKKAKKKKFVVGDQVMVESRDVKNKEAFLLSRWVGPYHVHKIEGDNVYQVRDEDLVFPTLYHANQMKLYKSRTRMTLPLGFYSIAC